MKLPNAVRNVQTISALLNAAEREARGAGEELPGAEHLLLAALDLEDGSARRAFARVGADADGVCGALAAQHADALRAIGIEAPAHADLDPQALPPATGLYKATPSGQAALHAAVDFQKRRRGSRLLGAHVVGAIAGMEHGTAARALRSLGIDREELRRAAAEEAGG